jgi:hypothetical protein
MAHNAIDQLNKKRPPQASLIGSLLANQGRALVASHNISIIKK